MSDERGFEVNDRRRVRSDLNPDVAGSAEPGPEEPGHQPAAAAEASAGEAGTPGEGRALAEEEQEPDLEETDAGEFEGAGSWMPPLDLPSILSMSFSMLSSLAWVRMGLLAEPVTGKIQRDLSEARQAIDAATDIARHLEPLLQPGDRREVQRAVTDMKLNFVRQSGEGAE